MAKKIQKNRWLVNISYFPPRIYEYYVYIYIYTSLCESKHVWTRRCGSKVLGLAWHLGFESQPNRCLQLYKIRIYAFCHTYLYIFVIYLYSTQYTVYILYTHIMNEYTKFAYTLIHTLFQKKKPEVGDPNRHPINGFRGPFEGNLKKQPSGGTMIKMMRSLLHVFFLHMCIVWSKLPLFPYFLKEWSSTQY